MRFENKVVIITGASRGIGRATAIEFDKEGAIVIGIYKSNETAAKEVQSLLSDRSTLMQADISKETEVKTLVKNIISKHKTIDILINNAGEIIRPGDWKTDVETWQKTMDVNLTSAWLMTREISPIMKNQKTGNIVYLSSTVGIRGVAPVMAYSCAKEALISMTKAMAKELAPHIRVNAVAPSNVMTEMTTSAGADYLEFAKNNTPLKRIAEPIELAKPILFLASDDASYITGHVLIVDGGHSLK